MSGAGTTYRTAVTTNDPSTTNTSIRTVSDYIAELYPEIAPMFAMRAKGSVKDGKVTGKGLLSKDSTPTFKFEWFTFTPPNISGQVASAGTTLTPILSSIDGVNEDMTVVNVSESAMPVAFIDDIDTTTKQLTLIDVSGDWTVAAGDRLVFMSPTYKQGSTDPMELTKDEDHTYNYVYIYRTAVSIAMTAKNDPHYGKKDYFTRLKERNNVHLARLIENALHFMERGSSSGKTTTTSKGSPYSTRGAWRWSSREFDCGGSMTAKEYLRDLPLAMSNTINSNDELVHEMGQHQFGDVQDWWWDKLQLQRPGMYDEMGIEAIRIKTSGPKIHIIKSDLFDQTGMQTKGLIYKPSTMTQMHKKGFDMTIKKGIQDNDEMVQRDEVRGTIGLKVDDGGASIVKVTNWVVPGAI